MKHGREILNLFALSMLFAALIGSFYLLRDLRMGAALDWGLALGTSLSVSPWLLMLTTGQMYSAAFFTELFIGGERAADRGYSRERAWAREGRGKDAALGLLLRDRLFGDTKGLWAVLEMARLDPGLTQEAVQAATRLIGSRSISAADRDHAGRVLQLAKVSSAKPRYSDELWR